MTKPTTSRQVRRNVERQVAKAGEQVYAARLRQARRAALRQRQGLKALIPAGISYPLHYTFILNRTPIEEAIMTQGIRL